MWIARSHPLKSAAALATALVYGQDAEGRERDGEAGAAATVTVRERWLIGIDTRARLNLVSTSATAPGNQTLPRFHLVAGPLVMCRLGPTLFGGAGRPRHERARAAAHGGVHAAGLRGSALSLPDLEVEPSGGKGKRGAPSCRRWSQDMVVASVVCVTAALSGGCRPATSSGSPSTSTSSATSGLSRPTASSSTRLAAVVATESSIRQDEAPRWPAHAGAARLPEDLAAGKRSEAQWREHLAHEDRERQLARDRHALADHKAIVAMLVQARREVVRARTPARIRAARARVAMVEASLAKRLARINVWGNVSPLTAQYQAMVQSLRAALPDTSPATSGAIAAGARADLDWDACLAEARAYLDQAAESEGEGE